jgi:hypothetical protein
MAEIINEENSVVGSENKINPEKGNRAEENNDFPNSMKLTQSNKVSHTSTHTVQNSMEESINHVHLKNDVKSKKDSSGSNPSKESKQNDKYGRCLQIELCFATK